jgi:nucleoside-diphosphate-sugar epimerase
MPSIDSSHGPVTVTGASGYVGAHVVRTLLERGYNVRGCVTDPGNPGKTAHLLALQEAGVPGKLTLYGANLLEEGSYNSVLEGCAGLLHVGTAMGYAGANKPQEVYDGAVSGTRNIMDSVAKAGTVKRVVYTSSFAAVGHPSPAGYVFTEADWASDGRENDPHWNLENLNEKDQTGYEMAKVEAEKMLYRIAEASGAFEAMSINPIVVLGPLLAKNHELVFSWQWALGRMLRGKPCNRGWQHLWNIVDVRDVAMAHVLALESDVAINGDRYILSATDGSGEIDCMQLQAHLQQLFPHIDVGGAPDALKAMLEKHGRVFDAPRAHCDKARKDLGLKTHAIEDTLRETGQTLIDLGIIEPMLKKRE